MQQTSIHDDVSEWNPVPHEGSRPSFSFGGTFLYQCDAGRDFLESIGLSDLDCVEVALHVAIVHLGSLVAVNTSQHNFQKSWPAAIPTGSG